jgi:hypothetical protein
MDSRLLRTTFLFSAPFRRTIFPLIILLGASGTTIVSKSQLDSDRSEIRFEHLERPPLYLPDAHYARFLTLGYNSLAAKLLWFDTVNYFGKQFAGPKDYRWLGNMCELVTDLDPKARHAFEFCGTLLAWVAKDPERSTALLNKAVAAEPGYWRYHFLRGFNYWYFLNRVDLAKDDFLTASKLQGAPRFLASLASRLIADNEGPTLARQFLQEMMANTQDPAAKEALRAKVKQAELSEALYQLQQATQQFQAKNSRDPEKVEELLSSGILKELPKDPYNGSFYIDSATGEVKTTSKKKGLEFKANTFATSPFGKTAQ